MPRIFRPQKQTFPIYRGELTTDDRAGSRSDAGHAVYTPKEGKLESYDGDLDTALANVARALRSAADDVEGIRAQLAGSTGR